MSKTLHLARCLRSFAQSDHNVDLTVVVLESKKFRYSASRFSRAVDHFEVITSPRESEQAYMDDIYNACRKYKATHFLPVAAPVEAIYDAQLKGRLENGLGMNFLHMDHALCCILDNKHEFGCFLRDSLKLRSPRTHIVSTNDEVRNFNKQFREEKQQGSLRRNMILKNLNYDPIHRLDLFQLPTSEAKLDAYLERITNNGNPITAEQPWQLQEFLANGVEYAAMIVVRSNEMVTMTCCPSSASQLNYIHTEIPSIRAWLEEFMAGLKQNSEFELTGQLCFDFMVLNEDDEQVAYPIECNPRVHTQCTIYNREDVRATLGSLLLEKGTQEKKDKLVSLLERDYASSSSPHGNNGATLNVFWFYNELLKIFPNSWLLPYNDSNDDSRRSKFLLSAAPLPSFRAAMMALVYLPAFVLSLHLVFPVVLLLLILPDKQNSKSNNRLSALQHLYVVYVKFVFFLDRLAFLHENIEADLCDKDPFPFIAKNHIQVASRLLATMRTGVEWKKVDFAIGKVVEVGGD